MAHLDDFPLFRNLTPGGKEILDHGLIRKEVAPVTIMLHRGAQVSGAYVVTRGSLRVFSISPAGTEATLYFINPGETCVLALNCLFNDLLYPAWVASESKTEVAIIPGVVFRKLFNTEASIQDLAVRALSTLVFRLMNELEQVHFCTLEQRLANLILLRASAEGCLRLTQQELAYHLGTSREVVARLMRGFVAQQLVETRRGLIVVKDAARLSALLAVGFELATCEPISPRPKTRV